MDSVGLLFTLTLLVCKSLIILKAGILSRADWPSRNEQAFSPIMNDSILVTIYPGTVLRVVDERYLSVCLSPRLLGSLSAYSLFRSKRFSALLRGLSPCYVRVGGTAAEVLTFNSTASLPDAHTLAETEQAYNESIEEDGPPPPFSFNGYQWDLVNELVQKNGARLIFGVNDMKRRDHHWDESNFLELLNYTLPKSYANRLAFEFGNEPNAYKRNFNVSINSTTHAKDFLHMYYLLKERKPYADVFRRCALIGPDVTHPQKSTLEYLKGYLDIAGRHLDKISWHQYYLKGNSPSPIGVSNFTDPTILDSLESQIQLIKKVVEKCGLKSKAVWLGETGSASGGGVPDLSNRYVAVFMWLDKLGLAARNGVDVVVRQTFYSYRSNYAFVYGNLEPLPVRKCIGCCCNIKYSHIYLASYFRKTLFFRVKV